MVWVNKGLFMLLRVSRRWDKEYYGSIDFVFHGYEQIKRRVWDVKHFYGVGSCCFFIK